MTFDVDDAILGVVLLPEDRRGGPHWAVADGVDNASNSQIVLGLFGFRGRRATSPCSISALAREIRSLQLFEFEAAL
jgi:hypothetical protein